MARDVGVTLNVRSFLLQRLPALVADEEFHAGMIETDRF